MAYKFIYVDDTQDDIERGTINGLQNGGELIINFFPPSDWETLIQTITNIIPEHNGIILDLRLNGNPYEENKYAKYRGSTLAQELRTLSKEERDKKDFPIILISADDNIEKSLDQTSLDLFDYVISKNQLGIDQKISFDAFKTKLKWLADGYTYLDQHEKKITEILNTQRLDFLDTRFIEVFTETVRKPTHIISRFLIKQIIERPSFLIDENYLAARLGVDVSSEDWSILLNEFIPNRIKYSGAFSNYYSRWWMVLLEEFWNQHISSDFSLRNSSSDKKVDLLIQKSKLTKLRPITRQPMSKSSSFWVICKASGVAIDTIDGFITTGQDDRFSWQEPEYISISEALRPTTNNSVSSIEYPRLQKLKEFYEANQQRIRK